MGSRSTMNFVKKGGRIKSFLPISKIQENYNLNKINLVLIKTSFL